jgi:uncharacterized membrane protein YgcG
MTDEPSTPEPTAPELPPTRMLEREQQLAYILAGLAMVASVGLVVAGSSPWWTLLLGGAGAAALVISTRRGHRIVTAFVAMAVGFVIPFLPLELLALVYAGFIMLRTSKAQAKINANKPRLTPAQRAEQRRQRREARRSGSSARGSSARGSGARGSGAGGSGAGQDARPVRPTASRRYTPPKSNTGRRR